MIMQTDTLIVRDTIREIIPQPTKVVENVTPIYVPMLDTVRVKDTVYLALQSQKKIYKEDDFYAEVSGYRVNIDYIEVYPTVTTITKTETVIEKASPWRFNVVVGVDYGRMEERYVTPNIGAEIGWKRWSVTASAGARMMVREGNTLAPIPYAEAGVRYRIVAR